MDKERLFQYVKTMITSSTNYPKYISISTVKMGDILGLNPSEIQAGLQELVNEGRLHTSKLTEPPNFDIYMLPEK